MWICNQQGTRAVNDAFVSRLLVVDDGGSYSLIASLPGDERGREYLGDFDALEDAKAALTCILESAQDDRCFHFVGEGRHDVLRNPSKKQSRHGKS